VSGWWRGWKGIVVAVLVAVAAYVAWIPAVADNAHPTLAALAAGVFWGALLVCLGLVVDLIRRWWSARYD
jgi:vacuolar-type H+-ATPase subunit I/STV1